MATFILIIIFLGIFSIQEIVVEMLGRYNKRLDDQQMMSLLSKPASENPLWLSIACEELRVFGRFRELTDKINKFPDGLLEYVKYLDFKPNDFTDASDSDLLKLNQNF